MAGTVRAGVGLHVRVDGLDVLRVLRTGPCWFVRILISILFSIIRMKPQGPFEITVNCSISFLEHVHRVFFHKAGWKFGLLKHLAFLNS